MKNLLILAGLCLFFPTTYAQETTASGVLGQEASWQALQSRINATNGNVATLRVDMNAVKKCSAQSKFWDGVRCVAGSAPVMRTFKAKRIDPINPFKSEPFAGLWSVCLASSFTVDTAERDIGNKNGNTLHSASCNAFPVKGQSLAAPQAWTAVTNQNMECAVTCLRFE